MQSPYQPEKGLEAPRRRFLRRWTRHLPNWHGSHGFSDEEQKLAMLAADYTPSIDSQLMGRPMDSYTQLRMNEVTKEPLA